MKFITLTQGKEAIVDDDMYDFLNKEEWCANKIGNTYYAVRTEGPRKTKKMIYMHRLVLPDAKIVDHINRNGLDNRRENLRSATHSQNHANRNKRIGTSSKYKGVSWYSPTQKWAARIMVNQKSIYIGYFESEDDAALAYNKAAIKYFSEYAKLNEIIPR